MLLLWSFFFNSIYAQKRDSLNTGLRNRYFAADSAAHYLYNLAKKTPFLTASLIPSGYNFITIGHEVINGDFKAIRSAGKSQHTYLLTEGMAKLKDVSLWGSFNYQKTSEDSTRWMQQSRNNISAPYYYGSPANINYERTVYNFKGIAERDMIHKNLPVALGIDYRIGHHYSTNDPRGDVADFQLNLTASVGYKLKESIKTGLSFKYGYGQERIRVDYKNEKYFQSAAYPDYINYVVNGYGEPVPKNNDRSYDNDQDRKGLEVYLAVNNDLYGNFLLTAGYLKETQFYNYKTSSTKLAQSHNNYDIAVKNAELIWRKTSNNKHLIATLAYQNTDGSDYNYSVGSNNYLYNSNVITFKSIFTVKGKNNYNYQLEVKKYGEERQDGLNGNLVGYNNLSITGGTGLMRKWEKQTWGINLNGIYAFPLNDQFVVPQSNEKIFTRDVIYHDYLFNTSAYVGASLNTDYSFPGYKQIQTSIKFNLNYLRSLNIKTLDRTLSFIPGNHRLSANLSLNLYF